MSERDVIPGIPYGIHGEVLPHCRSINALLLLLENDSAWVAKPGHQITAEDRCQRGPGGVPLLRLTPGVRFETLAEWEARGK